MPKIAKSRPQVVAIISSDLKRGDAKIKALQKKFLNAIVDTFGDGDDPPYPQPEVFPISPITPYRAKK
jgi:hypothetical protein